MRQVVTRSIVPNMLTLVNLFAGFTSLVYISHHEFANAALFILLAATFDMLDGIAARLFRATSEFGAELDSLCDLVSFGVSPAYMLYNVYFKELGEIGILLAALPALAGAVRLARFNVKLSSSDDKKYFHGLPIPSSALTIVSFIIFVYNPQIWDEKYLKIAITALPVMTSLAMVSNIRFDNIPRPTPKYIKQKPVVFTIFLIGLIISIITGGKFVFPFLMFYIITSALREFYLWIVEKRSPIEDLDETEERETNFLDL